MQVLLYTSHLVEWAKSHGLPNPLSELSHRKINLIQNFAENVQRFDNVSDECKEFLLALWPIIEYGASEGWVTVFDQYLDERRKGGKLYKFSSYYIDIQTMIDETDGDEQKILALFDRK